MRLQTRIRTEATPLWALFLLICTFSFSTFAKQANIVFIMPDDLDSETFSHSARIKKLIAGNGTTFDNHFVSLSLCCPSRTSILRGQYAHNTGVFTNLAPDGGFSRVYQDGLEHSTVATWLQAAGYRTALVGKYLNGYPNADSGTKYIPPGWNYWISPNGGKPYTQYNYSLNENGTTVVYGASEADYLDDVLSAKAASFILETKRQYPRQPFFLYLTPYAPHGPATPPKRYTKNFRNLQAPRPESFNEANVSDKPLWVKSKPLLSQDKISDIDALYRKRRRSMKSIGDLVKNVVSTLASIGELRNTYIFFTSDNGFHLGQHRLKSGKNTAFEEDIKVPLVVRGPGVAKGVTVSSLTANVDFAPTFAELANIAPPAFVDGRSLAPLLLGHTAPKSWRRVLLLENGNADLTAASIQTNPLLEPHDDFDIQVQTKPIATKPHFSGLRAGHKAIGNYGDFTYVEYADGEHELYWLSKDPLQLRNGYNNADPTLKTRLSTWLGLLQTASGQKLRDLEQTAP